MTIATAVLAYRYQATGEAAVQRSGHPLQSSLHVVKHRERSAQNVGKVAQGLGRSARDSGCRGSND